MHDPNPTANRPVAHTPNAGGQWHDWEAHARGTATLAQTFAAPFPFRAREVAWWLGLWHDLGKLDPDWQAYVEKVWRRLVPPKTGPDHALAGALLAERHTDLGALAIAGHHQGLPSLHAYQRQPRSPTPDQQTLQLAQQLLPDLDLDPASLRHRAHTAAGHDGDRDLLGRMLFSALVDADSLDVQAHFHIGAPTGQRPTLAELADTLQPLQPQRRSVQHPNPLMPCETVADTHTAAAEAPGCYRLDAPPGPAGVRLLLSFAAAHARAHGLARVIFALAADQPTAPIAATLKAALGDLDPNDPLELVVEQHASAYERPSDTSPAALATARRAAQNWDAPVVVTTIRVLTASLLSNLPAAMRKLHRLAHSVLVVDLDGLRRLPTGLRTSLSDMLTQLTTHYRTTVVLTTTSTAAPRQAAATHHGPRPHHVEAGAAARPVSGTYTASDDNPDLTASSAHGEIQRLRASLDYPSVAALSHQLLGPTVEVAVLHGPPAQEAAALAAITELTQSRAPLDKAVRALQPFLIPVRLHPKQASQLAEQGCVRWLIPGLGHWLSDRHPTTAEEPSTTAW